MPGLPNEDVFLVIDLRPIFKLKKKFESLEPKVFARAAERYRKYLFRRFIALSAGGSTQWPPLKKVTKELKEKKGVGNPDWILRESSTLAYSFEATTNSNGFEVGISNAPHPHSTLTVAQLAQLHQDGYVTSASSMLPGRPVPARPIVVAPDRQLYRMIVDDIAQNMGPIIRSCNR